MENKKESKSSSTVSIGNRLREAREKKSLGIDQVQKQTKIHSTVLIGLEEGRASDLLPDTYVRSFLKIYASFLGLQPNELLKEYFPAENETPAANIPLRENALPKETLTPPKFLYLTGITLVVIMLVFGVFFLGGKVISFFKKPHAAVKVSNISESKKKAVKKASKPLAKKKTANTSSKGFISKTAALNLIIKIKEPVLIKLKKDGILLFERVMPAGTVENVIAKDTIELGIGKARSVELALNGNPIALPDRSSIFGLEITRKGIRIR